ncbi:MAG: c-type cytochrome, partial [Candidatus Binatia bacterium]
RPAGAGLLCVGGGVRRARAALGGGDAAAAAGVKSIGRVLTFAVEGSPVAQHPVDAQVTRGEQVFHDHCAVCHGAAAVGGGVLPDLRQMNDGVKKVFPNIVKNGIPGTGMAGFGHVVTDDGVKALQAYIEHRRKESISGL